VLNTEASTGHHSLHYPRNKWIVREFNCGIIIKIYDNMMSVTYQVVSYVALLLTGGSSSAVLLVPRGLPTTSCDHGKGMDFLFCDDTQDLLC